MDYLQLNEGLSVLCACEVLLLSRIVLLSHVVLFVLIPVGKSSQYYTPPFLFVRQDSVSFVLITQLALWYMITIKSHATGN